VVGRRETFPDSSFNLSCLLPLHLQIPEQLRSKLVGAALIAGRGSDIARPRQLPPDVGLFPLASTSLLSLRSLEQPSSSLKPSLEIASSVTGGPAVRERGFRGGRVGPILPPLASLRSLSSLSYLSSALTRLTDDRRWPFSKR